MAQGTNPLGWQLPIDPPSDGPVNGQQLRIILQSLQQWQSKVPFHLSGINVGNGVGPTMDPATGHTTADPPQAVITATPDSSNVTVNGTPAVLANGYASVYQVAAVSPVNNSLAIRRFDTVDEAVGMTYNGATGLFTATTAGRYHVDAGVVFPNSPTGSAYLSIVDGTTTELRRGNQAGLNFAANPSPSVSATVRFAAGATFGIAVFQNSGAGLALVVTSRAFNYCDVQYVGP